MKENNRNFSPLEAQIRECFGHVVYAHKTQEKCADILNSLNSRIKFIQIILSAITSSGIIASLFGDYSWAAYGAAIVSFVGLCVNTYVKDFDLGSIAQRHSEAATSTWNIREKYLSLLTDLRSKHISDDEARDTRDKLQAELHEIYKGSPRTTNKAYKKAKEALQKYEENTFSDKEIDAFLPAALRKIPPVE